MIVACAEQIPAVFEPFGIFAAGDMEVRNIPGEYEKDIGFLESGSEGLDPVETA
jgi:hypothetical protein